MTGRKPKPAALKAAEGDTRRMGANKFAAMLAAEPHATRGLPDCPRHLKGRARATWLFWSEELTVMNLDNRPDGPMLEGACVSYARAVEADLILLRDGLLMETSTLNQKTGERVVKTRSHPAIAISNAAWRQVRAFASEFGLTPASRARVTPGTKPDIVDPLEKALCG